VHQAQHAIKAVMSVPGRARRTGARVFWVDRVDFQILGSRSPD
jgi:hypothetical protein